MCEAYQTSWCCTVISYHRCSHIFLCLHDGKINNMTESSLTFQSNLPGIIHLCVYPIGQCIMAEQCSNTYDCFFWNPCQTEWGCCIFLTVLLWVWMQPVKTPERSSVTLWQHKDYETKQTDKARLTAEEGTTVWRSRCGVKLQLKKDKWSIFWPLQKEQKLTSKPFVRWHWDEVECQCRERKGLVL